MKFGLTDQDLSHITKALSKFPEIEQAIILGSRAMGNFKRGSDVDIAIKGPNITHSIVLRLSSLLNEELPLPYYFDVLHYNSLKNKELIEHINNQGKIFFRRKD